MNALRKHIHKPAAAIVLINKLRAVSLFGEALRKLHAVLRNVYQNL